MASPYPWLVDEKCPFAVWEPIIGHSRPGQLAWKKKIVLHITQGPTAAGAIAWFKQSEGPAAVSAHFVIDRDGTIYQLVPLSDTAWHANAANAYSIGIEHAAIAGTLLATEEQYSASAMLVAWLCKLLQLPCDRNTVRTHYEVSQISHHALCCTGALNPDRVVDMAQKI